MIAKSKPWRSKNFMAFCHESMRDSALCAVCGERQWAQLHHWGSDGGMSMKPTDLKLVRMCLTCHEKHGHKERALQSSSCRMDREVAERLLSTFRRDAVELLAAYVQHLEGGSEGIFDCSADELTEWLATEAQGLRPDKQKEWLLCWAGRRAADIIDAFMEGAEDDG